MNYYAAWIMLWVLLDCLVSMPPETRVMQDAIDHDGCFVREREVWRMVSEGGLEKACFVHASTNTYTYTYTYGSHLSRESSD